MQLQINPSDALPIYRQIVRQVSDAIVHRRLGHGDKLPSHRDLAAQLVVAPLTVKKAYDELEREGFIEMRRGRGTFVAETLPAVDAERLSQQLAATSRRLLTEAALAGLDFRDLVALLERLHAENES